MKTAVVVGVDPGNDSAGLSFWTQEGIQAHLTLNPWASAWRLGGMLLPEGRVKVYGEIPQHGTHKSRGGVHFALGMIVCGLRLALGDRIRRQDVVKLGPSVWRAVVTPELVRPTREEAKEAALEAAKRWQLGEVESDDEAEAICIGYYGALTEGWDV